MVGSLFGSQVQNAIPNLARKTRQSLTDTLSEIDADAAKWVSEVHAKHPAKPSIVVVGETKRGKSSLVNALIGAHLSPVNAEVATATYLVFDHADSWQAAACYPGQRPEVHFPIEELALWTSATHELPAGQLPPRYVEVRGPSPLLDKVSIVDTPGVGGLDSMHGELAMEAAADATALLFVVDASAPLTAGELSFLRKAGEKVETVLFVVTKTDAFRGWRQIVDADNDLIAEHAPRFAGAEFAPVSARMADMAAKAPNQDAAAMIMQKSGLSALTAGIDEVVSGRAEMLHEANTLRAIVTAYTEQEARLNAERRALNSGESEADALRERRDKLQSERKSSTRGWQLKLRSEIQHARVDCTHEVSSQMRDVQSWFRQAIEASDKEKLAALPQEVDNALHVVSIRLAQMLNMRLNEAADNALAELFDPEELQLLRASIARAGGPQVVVRPPEQKAFTAEDKLMVGMGTYMGIGVGNMGAGAVTSLGAGSAIAGAAGVSAAVASAFVFVPFIALGLGAGWWIGRTRRHASNKQHVKAWLTESIAEARSTVDQVVAEQIIEAEHQLQLALDEALTKRIDAIETELKDVDKALKLDATEKSRMLTASSKQLKLLAEGKRKAEDVLEKIRARKDTV